ncbi:MAG: photosystem I reaction center subunit VIII [Leptolyngbya sp. SIO1D8]|nr:photosystem I reaction center subunit VIII [Leptolyngbya sp. SIO1D8]
MAASFLPAVCVPLCAILAFVVMGLLFTYVEAEG